MIAIKRAYEPATKDDGERILVDRLWPRGVSKEEAHFDRWVKDLAPSDELRKWFGHDPARWDEFVKRYREELKGREEPLKQIAQEAGAGKVTFIYGAKDEQHNNALALKAVIEGLEV